MVRMASVRCDSRLATAADRGEAPKKLGDNEAPKKLGDNYESVIASHFRVPRASRTDYYADAWAGHSVLRPGPEAQ